MGIFGADAAAVSFKSGLDFAGERPYAGPLK